MSATSERLREKPNPLTHRLQPSAPPPSSPSTPNKPFSRFACGLGEEHQHLQCWPSCAEPTTTKSPYKLGASKDHVTTSIAHLAKLGTWSKYENNVRRDLVHLLGDTNIPEPFFVDSPMANLMARLRFCHGPSTSCSRMRCSPASTKSIPTAQTSRAALEHFWRGVIERRDPRIKYHETCGRDGWVRCAVPCVFTATQCHASPQERQAPSRFARDLGPIHKGQNVHKSVHKDKTKRCVQNCRAAQLITAHFVTEFRALPCAPETLSKLIPRGPENRIRIMYKSENTGKILNFRTNDSSTVSFFESLCDNSSGVCVWF